MANRRSLLALPLLGLMLAACDDSTAPESQQLSASEAAALAVALDNSSSSAVESQTDDETPAFALLPAEGASRDVITETSSFDFNVPCPRGGTANLSGDLSWEINGDEEFIIFDLTADQQHDACAFRTNEGVDITVDGLLSFAADRELREGLWSASHTHSGALDYVTSDGKEGTCAIDITTEFSLTPGQATRTILGSVCGHEVDVSTSWTHTE